MAQLFVTLILFFGAAVTGFLYLGPEWTHFKTLRQEAETLQAVSAEMDELFRMRDTLFQKVNSVSKDDLSRLETAFPKDSARAPLLASLEAAAISHGLALKHMDTLGFVTQPSPASPSATGASRQPAPRTAPVTQPSQKGPAADIQIQMTVVGFYAELKQFLEALEKSVRVIDIQQLSFGSLGTEKTTAVPLEFKVLLKTYYQP